MRKMEESLQQFSESRVNGDDKEVPADNGKKKQVTANLPPIPSTGATLRPLKWGWQLKYVIHFIHKWQNARKSLGRVHESEAKEA